jgi:5-methylcytosine-specific restriction enzyme subunit McrC
MWQVFQDFVTDAVGKVLRGRGGRVSLQDPHHLDATRVVTLRPDMVIYGRGPTGHAPAAVLDAKYIVAGPRGADSHALYQALAYCTVLGLPRGHLVYAGTRRTGAGTGNPHVHRINGSGGVELVTHVLDLAAPTAELLAQIDVVADQLAADLP